MIKVVDTSVISALAGEIPSIDLMDIVGDHYSIVTVSAVIDECIDSGNPKYINAVMSLDELSLDEGYHELVDRISKISIRLHSGEINVMAASLCLARNGIENYAVIDDHLARKIFDRIKINPSIVSLMGDSVDNAHITGTIGLVHHLRDRGFITSDESSKIAFDLERSSFRISDDLLDLLR